MARLAKIICLLISVALCSEVACKSMKAIPAEKSEAQLLKTIRKLAKEAGHPNPKSIGQNRNSDEDEGEVCYTRPCLESAIQLLEAMDFKADPCDKSGFGSFACHRRLHRPSNNFHKSKYGNTSLLEWRIIQNQKISSEILNTPLKPVAEESSKGLVNAKIYYRQCLNLAENSKHATKALWKLSESFGGWPILTQKEPEDFRWEHFAAFLAQFKAKTFLFDVSPVVTENGNELSLDKGTLASTGLDVLEFKNNLNATLQNIRKHWNETGATFKLPDSFDNGIEHTMESFGQLRQYTLYFSSKIKTRMQISELNAFTHHRIGWLGFFQTAYKGTTIDIDEDTYVHVNKKYVEIFSKLWHSAGTWEASLLQYELFKELGDFTSLILNKEFHLDCTETAKIFFGAALSKEYLQRYPYTPAIRKDIEGMTDNILRGLKKCIKDSSFLFTDGKKKLTKKFAKVNKFLGYSPFLDHKENFTKYHSKLEMFQENGTEFFGNFMKLAIWREGVDRDGFTPSEDNLHYWDLNKFIVDTSGATFLPLANAMLIPAPTTAPPIYSFGAPGYINYGGIGTILAHELGHGMDPKGVFFDRDGNYKKNGLLGSGNQEIYNDWISSIKRDYGKAALHYHGKNDTTAKINTELTIGDDVADILGVQVAYNAYKRYLQKRPSNSDMKLPGLEHIPDEKLFFVTYSNMWCEDMTPARVKFVFASDHSPGYNRATVPLMRSKQFAETFKCEHNSEFEI